MSCIESLLLVARTYAEAEGLPLTTVSWRVFNAAGKVADGQKLLDAGCGFGGTIQQIAIH